MSQTGAKATRSDEGLQDEPRPASILGAWFRSPYVGRKIAK
jgi:hypothetical protein